MKNAFKSSVLLVLCLNAAVAQIFGPQTQFSDLNQRRQLSPQQQGHILSDIQQHQHRFNLHQNVLNNPQQIFPPQQFTNTYNNPQQFGNHQQNSGFVNSHPIIPTNVPQALSTPITTQQSHLQILPTIQTSSNPINAQQPPHHIQHHTQTGFTPNFQQATISPLSQLDAHQHLFQVTSSPLFNTDQAQQFARLDPEKQKEKLQELREKQAIIDKHNQYVEKQYEKALKKAQEEHSTFIKEQQEQKKKLYEEVYKPTGSRNLIYTQGVSRYIYPEETELFDLAIKKYYEEHPTTTTSTTTTTTTTTPSPPTSSEKVENEREPEVSDTKSNAEIFLPSQTKRYTEISKEGDTKKPLVFAPTILPTQPTVKEIQSLDDLSLLQAQYKSQQIEKDDLIAQLRKAIGEEPVDLNNNLTSREISLPNGQKVQIIRTTDPKLIPGAKPLELDTPLPEKSTTTAKPPKELFEELTKGVVPPGANFEILKHENGGLAEIGGLPSNQKKVTFVLLEEQNDGSFKVQGVKGNGAQEKEEVDVDSILKRIKDGEIKLPPSAKLATEKPSTINNKNHLSYAGEHLSYGTEKTLPKESTSPSPIISSTTTPTIRQTTLEEKISSVTITPNSFAPFSNAPTNFVSSTLPTTSFYVTKRSSSTPTPRILNLKKEPPKTSLNHDLQKQASTISHTRQNSIFASPTLQTKSTPSPPSPTVTIFKSELILPVPTQANNVINDNHEDDRGELVGIFRRSGLYAMAKFLRQSGLDTILNETGPYTIFAPNDKAFRTLLVQLGGPDKAEEKFKDNPRLLSGLLLHHVIPGAFKIASLQDEMTGVSLAGTQLRVNQYNMHDVEWNDIKITTINGAKVLEDKQDIDIPQGVAHGVDRVMFPLPVGDIVQTLQSDRERRFTSFLRAIFSSGLAEMLQGSRTFTVFAPTEKAFAALSDEDLTKLISDKALARELVMRHTVSGTLYTNGMRYYQIKDSLEPAKEITMSKSSGKVKVNNIQIATQNIPATNGVIHAIDSLL